MICMYMPDSQGYYVHLYLINGRSTHICPFSKSKLNLYEAKSLTASTLLHQLVLSIELGIVQTGTGKVDPARKFKCTKAARGSDEIMPKVQNIAIFYFSRLTPKTAANMSVRLTFTGILYLSSIH